MISLETFLGIIVITVFTIVLVGCGIAYRQAKFWFDKDKLYAAKLGFIMTLVGFLVIAFCMILDSPLIK